MSYSDYSPPESPYYDDDDDEPYYQSDDYFGDLVHVGSVRKESSESSLELERVFGDEHPPKKLLPLKELCCRFVGQNFPFGTVQLYPSRVPEGVQRRISFWSFPIEEKKLLDYAKVIGGATKYDVEIAREAKVTTMIQSGMYLTGTILLFPGTHYRDLSEDGEGESFRAYVQFDRGCITTTKCSCGERNWCRHVLALCLARVNESAPLQLHPPISETLTNLDREQLQKLVQYVLEKLPLDGVAAVQEIASSLLDKGSEISQLSGAPDLTAGGCPGDKPVWQMDKNVIISRLNSAYEEKVVRGSHQYYNSTACLQDRKAALVGFKEFTSDSSPNTPSELCTLLRYEDDNLSIALKWALEKLAKESSRVAHDEPAIQILHQDAITKGKKWAEWCFCRMLLPVMQMFFVSPAISSCAKEDVTECLSQCLQQDPSNPIIELLHCFMQIATHGVCADAQGRRQLLTYLQQAVSRKPSLHTLHDNMTGELVKSDAALLHCTMAVVQHSAFSNHVGGPEIEDMLATICSLLFPATLADVASLEELVAIRSDHGLQEMSVHLLLEYGTVLLQCTSTPDLAAELVFKLMGSQLPLNTSSTDVLVFCNWAENTMITAVDEAKTFIKASPEVKSTLAGLAIKWLTQTCAALERDSNPIATLTGMWSMMRLVCHCATDTDDCLKIIKQMTQKLIGMMSSTLPNTTLTPEAGEAAQGSNLPMEVMADSFTGLLVDLFTMLPSGDREELFITLYKVYPKPVDAKKSLEKGHYRYKFGEWQQRLLNAAYALSQRLSSPFFPKEPSMEEFEQQLDEASQDYRYGMQVYRQAIDRPRSQKDEEKAEILQICRTQCSVSTSHVSFLQQLHKRLQEAGAPLQFELQLLIAQVSNCANYGWALKSNSYEHHNLYDTLLASNDIGSSLQTLKDVWKFSISPESVLQLLEAIQDKASPELADIMCNILISVLDCEASHHPRVFTVMLKIGAPPEHIFQAITIASCSSNNQKGNQRTTIIHCTEALGKSYNKLKASGAAEEILLKIRAKAVELLQQPRSMLGFMERSAHLQYACSSQSVGVDVQAVKQVVCDSGPQALDDLLTLMVKSPGGVLLPSLEVMQELCNYYHKDIPGGQSKPLQMPPFKETVASLLERRKSDIKKMAASHGESGIVRQFLDDLKASFLFLGDEAAFTAFEQDLAPLLRSAGRLRVMPLDMAYGRVDHDQVASVWQMMAAARASQMRFSGDGDT